MPRRYFNWKLAAIIVISIVVLGVTAFGLRKWQRHRMAYGSLEKGNQAYENSLWDEAAKNLGRYIAVVSTDVPVLLKYANAQLNIRPLKQNNVQQSIAAYRTILRIDKNNLEAASSLTEIYLQMAMPGEAELIASRALQTNQSPKLHRMLAIALANQRKFEEAAKELRDIIKDYPDQISAYDILGQLTEQRPEVFTQTPRFWFDEAIKNNPASADAYIIRAAYYLRHANKDKALADLEQAEKQDLSDTNVHLHLAKEFINANVFDKAQKHLEAIQSVEPVNLSLWQTWAQLALKSESPPLMLKTAETGLKELASQPWDFMSTAAELYLRCDKLDLADNCISKLRQKDIAPPNTAFLEGLLAEMKGQNYDAVKHWYRAIQLGEDSGRTRLSLALVLSQLGDRQAAINQLRNLVSEQPNFIRGRLALARLFIENANWAEAADQARAAQQISPENLEAALLYTQVQIQLLAESRTGKDSAAWQDIENRLAILEKASENPLPVKILQLQLATQRLQFDKAQLLLNNMKNDYPNQLEVAMAEVKLLNAQDKIDQAILKLEDTIKIFPQSLEPIEYLVILLARQDSREKCEDIIQDALVRMQGSAAKHKLSLLLVDLYNRWNQQEKAYELLNSLAQQQPNDVLTKRRLLTYQQVTKNPEEAQQLVNEIKSLEGENGWQWKYEQAKIWFTSGNFKDLYPQIISTLKENLLANADDQASRMLLAAAYDRAGEMQLAIATYNEALNRSPQDLRIIVPAVAALYKANEYNRADEILRRAASQKIFHPELQKLELQSHLRRGELGSASDILESMLAKDPNNQAVCLSLALLKMRQKSYAEAAELLTELKMHEPDSLPIKVAQIELNVRQNNSAEALLLCDDVVKKSNDASAYILRARTHFMLGQTDNAKEDFEHAATIEPDNTEAWLAKSDFCRSTGHFDEAVTDIQKAMSLKPENLAICKRAIPLLLSSPDRDRILKGKFILNKALESNPDDIDLRFFKARSLLAEGTAPAIEQAAKILQKITEDQPNLNDPWILLAEIALNQKQPAKALDIALRGLVHQSTDKSLLLIKARAEATKSPALAIPTLKALLELDPNDSDVVGRLADTYIANSESQKAVNLLETQLASCTNTSDKQKLNIALAVALHKNGNKAEAQRQFDLVSQAAPDDPALLLAKAQLLRDDQLWDQLHEVVIFWCQSHPKDIQTPVAIAKDLAAAENQPAQNTAKDILRTVLENNPDCGEAMTILAMLLQITGQFAESATVYQQILAIQPDNVIVINNLAWILSEEQAKYQEALELALRGLEIAPDYIDLIDTRGVIYYHLSEFDKAVQDFNRCIQLYSPQASSIVASHLHLAKALAALQQRDKAIESLKKALELNTKIGGLSQADYAEAQSLLETLSKGG